MIFDKFCTLAERHFSELIPVAENSKLFIFDKPAHKYLKKNAGLEYAKYKDVFSLPFKTTAIEDPASLIIFIDSEEDQVGFSQRRDFIEVIPWDLNEAGFREEGNVEKDKKKYAKFMEEKMGLCKQSACSITAGSIYEVILGEKGIQINGEVKTIVLADKNKIFSVMDDRDFKDDQKVFLNENGLSNAITGIEELLTITTAEKFILEEKPAKQETRKKKVLRSHQRERYSILTAKEIRTKMKIENQITDGDRRSPVPHERRSHYRRLYKEHGFKEDKIIAIKATWVGQSEKQIGNKMYRVRLDITM